MKIHEIRQASAIAVDWIARHVEHADPFAGDSPAEYLFRRKCFNELAMLLMFHDRFDETERPAIARIRDFLATHLDDDYISIAVRRSASLLMFTCALGYAVRHGLLDDARRAFIRDALSSRFAWGIEGSAFRHLELLTACRFAGATPPIDIGDVMRTSALALAPSPLHGAKNAYYALTHAEIYRTLLGHAEPSADPYLRMSLKGGIGRARADGDFDLALELVEASCLRDLRLEPESLLAIESVVGDLMKTGYVSQTADSIIVEDFCAQVPLQDSQQDSRQVSWARKFHVMLVAATCLMVVARRFESVISVANARERDNASRIGNAILAFHQYRFMQGMTCLEGVKDASPGHRQLLGEIAEFVRFNRRFDGHFGHFVDELNKARRMRPELGDAALLSAPVDDMCRAFLARHAPNPAENSSSAAFEPIPAPPYRGRAALVTRIQ